MSISFVFTILFRHYVSILIQNYDLNFLNSLPEGLRTRTVLNLASISNSTGKMVEY